MTDRLKSFRNVHEHVYAERHAARPTLGSLLEGCVDRQGLQDAAHAAFYRHAYTLAEIASAISRHPSVVSRWIQEAERRASSRGDIAARNKI